MTTEAIITLLIFVAVVVLLIWQPIHPILVGAAIPTLLVILGIIDPKTAYSQFTNSTVVICLGLSLIHI